MIKSAMSLNIFHAETTPSWSGCVLPLESYQKLAEMKNKISKHIKLYILWAYLEAEWLHCVNQDTETKLGLGIPVLPLF